MRVGGGVRARVRVCVCVHERTSVLLTQEIRRSSGSGAELIYIITGDFDNSVHGCL